MSWNEPYNYQETIDVPGTQRIVNLSRRYRPKTGDLLVFINGILARRDIDYREVNSYTLEFFDDLVAGDTVICQLQKLW
ncbi:hypothetical protein D3C85_879410 [compost metagenome]